jgi:Ca2+/H+ antiporter
MTWKKGGAMIFAELVFALAIALFLTVVFTVMGGRAKSRKRIVVFFFIVFLAAWAGGLWITPVGPAFLGVYWLSFFVVGLIFALLLEAGQAFSKPAKTRDKKIQEEELDRKEERELESTLSAFFIILILAFVLVIIIGYIYRLK